MITTGSSMLAMTLTVPPHSLQVSIFRLRWATDVTAQPLQLLALMGPGCHPGMQTEPGHVRNRCGCRSSWAMRCGRARLRPQPHADQRIRYRNERLANTAGPSNGAPALKWNTPAPTPSGRSDGAGRGGLITRLGAGRFRVVWAWCTRRLSGTIPRQFHTPQNPCHWALFDAFSGTAIRLQESWSVVWMVHSSLTSQTLELNGGVSFRAVKVERFVPRCFR